MTEKNIWDYLIHESLMRELSMSQGHLNLPNKLHCKNKAEMTKQWFTGEVRNYLYGHTHDVLWNKQLVEEMKAYAHTSTLDEQIKRMKKMRKL
jgi:hypothetical protein